ncbi:MAG: hypothetical protein ACTSQY_02250 [Candidatus Odinarchaeia archaeon]
MWLIIVALAAAVSTAIWYTQAGNDKYMLNILSLIFWGTTIMVLVDHVLGFLMEGGEFIEMTAEAGMLGAVLVVVALVVWELILMLKDPKGVLWKKSVQTQV